MAYTLLVVWTVEEVSYGCHCPLLLSHDIRTGCDSIATIPTSFFRMSVWFWKPAMPHSRSRCGAPSMNSSSTAPFFPFSVLWLSLIDWNSHACLSFSVAHGVSLYCPCVNSLQTLQGTRVWTSKEVIQCTCVIFAGSHSWVTFGRAAYKTREIERLNSRLPFIVKIMLPLVVFITLGLSWLTWRFARNFFVRSPLDNIPGPVSTSWFGGIILHR